MGVLTITHLTPSSEIRGGRSLTAKRPVIDETKALIEGAGGEVNVLARADSMVMAGIRYEVYDC